MAKIRKGVKVCEYCGHDFTLRLNGNKKRYNCLGLVVCTRCVDCYYRHGEIRPRRVLLTPEEKRLKYNKLHKEYEAKKQALVKERTKFLKSISPEELLDIVRNSAR